MRYLICGPRLGFGLQRARSEPKMLSSPPVPWALCDLLLRCRDVTGSLPNLSPRLGEQVRTNSKSFLGSTCRQSHIDYSKGLAINSFFQPDSNTTVEAVRYPAGSSLMRFFSAPLIESGEFSVQRWLRAIAALFRHPIDFLRVYLFTGWAEHTTLLMTMRREDHHLTMKLGRRLLTLFPTRFDFPAGHGLFVSHPGGGWSEGYQILRRQNGRHSGHDHQ